VRAPGVHRIQGPAWAGGAGSAPSGAAGAGGLARRVRCRGSGPEGEGDRKGRRPDPDGKNALDI